MNESKYFYLLSFADIDETEPGKAKVLLQNEYGLPNHINPQQRLPFGIPFPKDGRKKAIILNANGDEATLISIMAKFNKVQFDFYRPNIPSLGNWEDGIPVPENDVSGSMDVILPPP